MSEIENIIEKALFENQDLEYREFHSRLILNIDKDKIIGVRTPVVRKLAAEFSKDCRIGEFLSSQGHKYYDENNLHGFIICACRDYEKTVGYLDEFLPFVDNWATCDLLRPKSFKNNRQRLTADIKRWINSGRLYTVRFGIGMLMCHFLDGDFDVRYLETVSRIKSDEYYVNMMIAWYFATALSKQWDSAVAYLENRKLDSWVHNKTITKAIESYRITSEQKQYLKTLKIKNQ